MIRVLPVRSPWRADPDLLERILVGRQHLARLVEDVFDVALAGGAVHVLFVGPAGCGRSHRLAILARRLSRRLRVAAIDEDSHVASLADLYARLAAGLGAAVSAGDEQGALAALDAAAGTDPAAWIIDRVDLVLDAIGSDGASRLRAALQERGRWSVIGGSRAVGPAFTDRASPFFQAFAVHRLPDFSAEGGRAVLARLADATDPPLRASLGGDPARMRALHAAIGGRPGAWAQLFPYVRDGLDDPHPLVHAYAEAMSPTVRRYVTALSAAQRAVYAALLAAGNPRSVGDLGARLGVDPKLASTMLRRLESDGAVMAVSIGRERLYEPADPLHRLVGDPDRERVIGAIARVYRAHGGRDARWGARQAGDEARDGALDGAIAGRRSGPTRDWAALSALDRAAGDALLARENPSAEAATPR